jgi:hypothetical protein
MHSLSEHFTVKPTLTIEIGQKYKFTLQSGYAIDVVVYGSSQNAGWIIAVNGVRDIYPTLDAALGDAFVAVERV